MQKSRREWENENEREKENETMEKGAAQIVSYIICEEEWWKRMREGSKNKGMQRRRRGAAEREERERERKKWKGRKMMGKWER